MAPPPIAADFPSRGPTRGAWSLPGAGAMPRASGGARFRGVMRAVAAELRDARLYQILCLGGLLVFGVSRLDLEVRGSQAAVILLTVLATQYAGARVGATTARFDPRSALISGLSLCLLLRTNVLILAALTAVIAIASKFVLRIRGKHVFNPTNFALVVDDARDRATSGSRRASGGAAPSSASCIACAGGLVVNRALAQRRHLRLPRLLRRHAVRPRRCGWGIRSAIPLHRLQNGALLLFAFFMISDPRTTPGLAGRPHPVRRSWSPPAPGSSSSGSSGPTACCWSLAFWSLAGPADRPAAARPDAIEWRPAGSRERRRAS